MINLLLKNNQLIAHIRTLLSKHPSFKKIIANINWLSFDRVIRMVGGFFVAAWVARYLGPTQFGALSYALAVTAIGCVPVRLGLQIIGEREFVRSKDKKQSLLGTIAALRSIAGIAAYGLIAAYALLFTQEAVIGWLLLIIGSRIVTEISGTLDSWFASQLQSKYGVLSKNIAFLCFSVIRVLFILTGQSVIAFAFAYLIDYLIIFGFTIYFYILKNEDILKWRFDLVLAKTLLKESWPALLSNVASMISMRIDQVILVGLSSSLVGMYASSVRISELFLFVPSIIAASIFPNIIMAKKKSHVLYNRRVQQFYYLNTAIAYSIAVPTFFLAPWLIDLLYGNEYSGAARILQIHVWSNLFAFLGIARARVLVNEGHVGILAISTIGGALISITLNYLFVPAWGATGAAFVSIISRFTAALAIPMLFKSTYKSSLMMIRSIFFPILFLKKI